MRVLVTGGAGFIGAEVVRQLVQRGDTVTVVDDLSQGHADALPVAVALTTRDIRSSLDDLMSVDAVIHLAALVALSDSVADPAPYWSVNSIGTFNLLEAMVRHRVKKLVFASSAAVYGDPFGGVGIVTEDTPLASDNAYGQSKAWAEHMIETFCAAYGMHATSFRFFNVAGAGERHDPETHLFPNVVKAIREDQPLNIYGFNYETRDGTALRDYIHVSDIAGAHLLALEQTGYNVYNLGNGLGYTCLEVIEAVGRAAGKGVTIRECPRRPGDIAGLVADYKKAVRELGWQPQYTLDDIARAAWNG